jgi:hypothetical protein
MKAHDKPVKKHHFMRLIGACQNLGSETAPETDEAKKLLEQARTALKNWYMKNICCHLLYHNKISYPEDCGQLC